jgi:hypothetical protein
LIKIFKGFPLNCHGLQICAWATVASVAGFENEKSCNECKRNEFLPIFHDKIALLLSE